MKIFVGNLSFKMTEETVRAVFESHGQVESVTISKDAVTSRSRGFGFVDMPNHSEAQEAVTALNGRTFGGRALTVNVSRPKTSRGFGEGAFRANIDGYRRTEARWS